MTWRVLITYV
jgi:hypothetical protein